MKRFSVLILISLFVMLLIGCSSNSADDVETFPVVTTDSFIQEDKITIPEGTDALHIFNCFYSIYGYGEFDIRGDFSHTETALLNGRKYTDTVSKTLIKIKIWHEVDSNKREEHISSFYVTFFTDNGESIEYRYQWQYHNINAWKNNHSNGIIEIIH